MALAVMLPDGDLDRFCEVLVGPTEIEYEYEQTRDGGLDIVAISRRFDRQQRTWVELERERVAYYAPGDWVNVLGDDVDDCDD